MSDKRFPRHVAIILDGNGRWAQQRGRERTYGHQVGAANVKNIVRAAGREQFSVAQVRVKTEFEDFVGHRLKIGSQSADN